MALIPICHTPKPVIMRKSRGVDFHEVSQSLSITNVASSSDLVFNLHYKYLRIQCKSVNTKVGEFIRYVYVNCCRKYMLFSIKRLVSNVLYQKCLVSKCYVSKCLVMSKCFVLNCLYQIVKYKWYCIKKMLYCM